MIRTRVIFNDGIVSEGTYSDIDEMTEHIKNKTYDGVLFQLE